MNLFALIMGIGASMGLWHMLQKQPRWQAHPWLFIGLIVYALSLLGARASYVLLHFTYYSENFLEVYRVWQGGFTWPGAVLFGLFSLLLSSWLFSISFDLVLSAFSDTLPALITAAWLGALERGIAYGFEVPGQTIPFLAVQDELGIIASRFPLQIVAAVTTLLIYFWFENVQKHFETPGQKGSVSLLIFSFTLSLFSFFRADPMPVWKSLRFDSWAAILFFVFSLFIFVLLFFRKEKASTEIMN